MQPEDLQGTWDSSTCESIGNNTYIQRHFSMTEATWELNLNAFGDAQCQTKLFTTRVGGPYTLEKDSTLVKGATEARFGFQTSTRCPW